MSNIDIFDDEIATASDDALREWKAGLRHSDYPGIAHDIIGRIIDEQVRRARLAPDKPCACGREGSLDHEDFCMPKSMWPRHWVTGEATDPGAALAPDKESTP